MTPRAVARIGAALSLLVAGAACQRGLVGADEGPIVDPIRESTGTIPVVTIAVRGELVAGRPVPYRVTVENVTADVLIPISADAQMGRGGARWAKPIVGEVLYDAEGDRFLENPVAQRASSHQFYRSAIAPGEALVEEFEVRYEAAGPIAEQFRVLFHRLSESEFDQRIYVATGGGVPRPYGPVGLLADPGARRGALLAGFLLRADRAPEAVTTAFEFTMPSVPPSVATKITAAGFSPARVLAASWASGWITGDDQRSLVVPQTGAPRTLAGIPFSALQVVDQTAGNVSFCVTGASREEIAPLFKGYDIVPHKCLHVSVPKDEILKTLEGISSAGFAVVPIDFQLREALDVVKRKASAEPVATPSPSPSPSPSPRVPARK